MIIARISLLGLVLGLLSTAFDMFVIKSDQLLQAMPNVYLLDENDQEEILSSFSKDFSKQVCRSPYPIFPPGGSDIDSLLVFV